MTDTPRKPEPEYGPLGPGHAPEKDPLKGFRGVASGTLVMEAITMGLVLTVIGRIDSGAYWTAGNATFVIVVAVAHLVLAFLQRFSLGLPAALVLQVISLGGFFVHPSMGIIALIFCAVWWYLMHLRSRLVARMERGLLTTQHM